MSRDPHSEDDNLPKVVHPATLSVAKGIAMVIACALASIAVYGVGWVAHGIPSAPIFDAGRLRQLTRTNVLASKPPLPPPGCSGPFLETGNATGDNAWYQDQRDFAISAFYNDTDYNTIVTLAYMGQPRINLPLAAQSSTTFQIPYGTYTLLLRAGTTWCQNRRRFSDEQDFELPIAITISNIDRTNLAILHEGSAVPRFSIEMREHALVGQDWTPRTTQTIDMISATAYGRPGELADGPIPYRISGPPVKQR